MNLKEALNRTQEEIDIDLLGELKYRLSEETDSRMKRILIRETRYGDALVRLIERL